MGIPVIRKDLSFLEGKDDLKGKKQEGKAISATIASDLSLKDINEHCEYARQVIVNSVLLEHSKIRLCSDSNKRINIEKLPLQGGAELVDLCNSCSDTQVKIKKNIENIKPNIFK